MVFTVIAKCKSCGVRWIARTVDGDKLSFRPGFEQYKTINHFANCESTKDWQLIGISRFSK